jgi:hypothetical protein
VCHPGPTRERREITASSIEYLTDLIPSLLAPFAPLVDRGEFANELAHLVLLLFYPFDKSTYARLDTFQVGGKRRQSFTDKVPLRSFGGYA